MILFTLSFLITRLINISSLPIFNDESIYLRWGQLFLENGDNWKISLIIGGRPPGVAVIYSLLQIIPFDALIVTRIFTSIFSIITFVTTLGLYKKLYPKHSSFYLTLFLCLCPFLVFFDRLALIDSLITAIASAALYILYEQYRAPSLLKACLLGLIFALGWWLKSSILLFLPAVILAGITHVISSSNKTILLKYYGTTVIIFIGCMLPLILHPLYQQVGLKEQLSVLTISELLSLPFTQWLNNIWTVFQYHLGFTTPAVAALFIVGTAVILRNRKNKLVLLPFVWCIIPQLIEIFSAKVLTARYMMYSIPTFLFIASVGLHEIHLGKKFVTGLTLVGLCISSLIIIISPLTYYRLLSILPVAQTDFAQYVRSWPSGYGVREASDWIKTETSKPVFVFVRSDSGNPEDAAYIYLRNQPAIKVLPLTYLEFFLKEKNNPELKNTNLYFISRGPQYGGYEKYMKEVKKFSKPMDDEFIGVYKINIYENKP